MEAQVDLLCRRLADADAGFTVYRLPAERILTSALEELMASLSEPADEILFLFAGYVVVGEKGIPALLLDGDRLSTLSLRRVRRLLSEHARSSFVVLDTVTAFSTSWAPGEIVAMCDTAISAGQEDVGLHVLAANRTDPDGPSPFLNLLVLALDWHSGDEGLSPDSLFYAMRREEGMFSQIAHLDLFASAHPFRVLLPRLPPSIPPSVPPPPSGEGAESRGDELVRAGEYEAALVEYTVALDHELPSASLYTKLGVVLAKLSRLREAGAYYEAALGLDPNCAAALDGAATLREEAGDRQGAILLLERRLHADPDSLLALERAARLHGELENWEGLALLYESVLTRVTDPKVSVDLAHRLDELCSDELRDPDRACASLEHVVSLSPDDVVIRLRLSRLLETRGDPLRALGHLLAALRIEPANVAGYRTAMRLFDAVRDPDGSWNAACALEALGDADVNESLLASAHRPDGLLPVSDSLTEEHWMRRMLSPERDVLIDEMFSALGSAIVELGLETAARKRRMPATGDGASVDPAKSTATLVRMLSWSSRLLGIPVPKVHVMPALPSAFLVPPTREPTLLVSKTLGTGLGMPELAFLWARQLTFLRPEHVPLRFFPSVPELSALLLATLSIGKVDKVSLKKLDGDAKLFARGLRRHVPAEALGRIESLSREFPLGEATTRVTAWARGVELAAARAGLLACGNLETAVTMTRRFPLRNAGGPKSSKGPEPEVLDLLAYAVSSEYGALRSRLGVKLLPRDSRPPPAHMRP